MRGSADLKLADGTRLIHIGPQKTGTTTIQVALHTSRAALAEHGVEYAGEGSRPRKAGWALGLPGRITLGPPPPIRVWERLAAEVTASTARIVVASNEDFGGADDAQAARIVADLGGGKPHVVMVARRLDRILPSQWQQRVRFGEGLAYGDWLADVFDESSTTWTHRNFWRSHDLEAMIARWAGVAGADNVTLVVGDDADRDLLPRTFDALLGLPDGFLVEAVRSSVQDRALAANEALGWVETELVRRLNVFAQEQGWSKEQRRDVIRLGVIHGIKALPSTHPDRSKAVMPAWAAEAVAERSRRRRDAVLSSGVRVVGDPDLLLAPDTLSAGDVDPPTTLNLETALAAITSAVAATAAHASAEAAPSGQPEEPSAPAEAGAGSEPLVDRLRSRLGKIRQGGSA